MWNAFKKKIIHPTTLEPLHLINTGEFAVVKEFGEIGEIESIWSTRKDADIRRKDLSIMFPEENYQTREVFCPKTVWGING